MSAPTTDPQWFYVQDDDQIGPLTRDQLIRAVAKGIVQPDTLVWRDGLKDWVEASRIKFLNFVSDNPYAAPGRDSDDDEEEDEEEDPRRKKKKKKKRIEYGTFWNRFVGNFVDNIIVTIASYAIFFGALVVLISAGNKIEPRSFEVTALLFGILSMVYWLYFACMESSPLQATVGKLAAGIKVINEDGDGMGFLQATGRSFLRMIFGSTLVIGFLVMPFTAKKQALHDLMMGTFVVKV